MGALSSQVIAQTLKMGNSKSTAQPRKSHFENSITPKEKDSNNLTREFYSLGTSEVFDGGEEPLASQALRGPMTKPSNSISRPLTPPKTR